METVMKVPVHQYWTWGKLFMELLIQSLLIQNVYTRHDIYCKHIVVLNIDYRPPSLQITGIYTENTIIGQSLTNKLVMFSCFLFNICTVLLSFLIVYPQQRSQAKVKVLPWHPIINKLISFQFNRNLTEETTFLDLLHFVPQTFPNPTKVWLHTQSSVRLHPQWWQNYSDPFHKSKMICYEPCICNDA